MRRIPADPGPDLLEEGRIRAGVLLRDLIHVLRSLRSVMTEGAEAPEV
jgi:hypothetical protein